MRTLSLTFTIAMLACGGGSGVQQTAVAPPIAKPAPELPTLLPAGTTRLLIGGDSRDDQAHVLPWAFRQAKLRGASGFFFLGDMELTPSFDAHFRQELDELGDVPFFPALGNHEVKLLGAFNFGRERAERKFRENFLDKPRTPVRTSIDGRVVYSVNLPNHIHFVILDNVSHRGFGPEQLEWLASDLEAARTDPNVRHVFVGMHKPLAGNGVTTHSMEEDGERGIADSNAALDLFEHWRVELIFASHLHAFAEYRQRDIRSYITGGLGAPLIQSAALTGFHHFIQVDVAGDEVKVDVVRFDGKPSIATEEVETGE